MRIQLLSPYHGGSHQAWAEGYRQFSQHDVQLLTLPARFWKWRMHGGAVTLAREFMTRHVKSPEITDTDPREVCPEVIMATDMVDLTTFLALTRRHIGQTPSVLYMHENQLTYPLPVGGNIGPMRRQKGERDLHYAFINFASMLAADKVFFNSRFHLQAFFDELARYLRHFPEFNELDTMPTLQEKSQVLPVGIDLQRFDEFDVKKATKEPPLIIWNQRWEYDKNPELFFSALYAIAKEGIPFRLALCGENFRRRPAEFDEASERLSEHIIYQGHAPDELYAKLLWQASVTISTAFHEFFGISVLEAIYCRTFPVLPHRLSYPELVPAKFHEACLYNTEEGMLRRIRWALKHSAEAEVVAADLAKATSRYDWNKLAPQYDQILSSMV